MKPENRNPAYGIVRLTAEDVIDSFAAAYFKDAHLRLFTIVIEVMPSVEHVKHKYQNNRAENSHQLSRVREKVMRRFKSAGHAQRFLSPFGIITSHFRVGRHLYSARSYREVLKLRFAGWEEVIHSESAS